MLSRCAGFAFLLGGSLLSLSAAAQPTPPRPVEKSEEDMLKELEKSVEKKETPAAKPTAPTSAVGRFIQSLNPDISVILALTGAYFNDRALTSGNAVPEGEIDPQKTGFNLQELEIAFQAAVDPYFRLDTFLSISLEGLEIEESYVTTLSLPAGLQLRFGLMKQKFGRQNLLHSHNWSFIDEMLPVARLLGRDGFRTVAFETNWLLPVPWYVELSMSIGQPTGGNVRAFVGEGARADTFHINDPSDLLYVFHLAQHFDLSADWGMSLGLSYALGPNGAGGTSSNRTHLFGGDLFLKWRPLRGTYTEIRFTTEGYGRLIDVPEARLFDWGLYAMLTFRLSQRWFVGVRYDRVDIGDASRLVQYGFAQPAMNPEQPVPLDDQNRASIALTWQPTEFSQIRLQYSNDWIRRTTGDGLPGKYGQVHEVFLQFQGNIGTHGAHPY
jgi:hypothetical protein